MLREMSRRNTANNARRTVDRKIDAVGETHFPWAKRDSPPGHVNFLVELQRITTSQYYRKLSSLCIRALDCPPRSYRLSVARLADSDIRSSVRLS
jgi:hypothetical protein